MEAREPTTGSEGADPLEEARLRLASLDELPLEEHPAAFGAVDELLRNALEGGQSTSAAN